VAQADASPAAMTNLEHPLELFFDRRLVVVRRLLPLDAMPSRCLEIPFAYGHRGFAGWPAALAEPKCRTAPARQARAILHRARLPTPARDGAPPCQSVNASSAFWKRLACERVAL